MSRHLLLWLEAPLQSWGNDSRFGRRSSLEFPTRSGVLGLLCCACGRGGPQEEWFASWRGLDMTVVAYVRMRRAGKTPLPEPQLRDFHMVGGGYDSRDPWEELLEPHLPSGKRRNGAGGGLIVTQRYYIQDGAFAVALEVPDALVQEVVRGLQMPAWEIYLGRKCCVPSKPVYAGVFDRRDEALAAAGKIAERDARVESFRVVQDERADAGDVLVLQDVPLRMGKHKAYRSRTVTVIHGGAEVVEVAEV